MGSVKSPCTLSCQINRNKICVGCFRSLEEITDWRLFNDAEKRDVLCRVEIRRRGAQSH